LEAAIAAKIRCEVKIKPPSSSSFAGRARGVMKQGEPNGGSASWSRKTAWWLARWNRVGDKLQDQKAAEAELARKETNNDCNSPICSWNRSVPWAAI